jgi:hypothetical protein
MIDFDTKIGSTIAPVDESGKLPSEDEVRLFFENFFKKNVEDFLIYKKNQFKNPNKEVLSDFISKFESFVKQQNNNEDLHVLIQLTFFNINNSLKVLQDRKCVPDNQKILAFFVSFIISKIF